MLKKSNSVYLDNFQRDRVNEKLNADIRQQELDNKSEKDNGTQIIAQIINS